MPGFGERLGDFFIDLYTDGAVRQGDVGVLEVLRSQPNIPATRWLEPMGGLVGVEANFPQSAATIVPRLQRSYGESAVQRLRAADARVLSAVRDAATVRRLLIASQTSFQIRTHEVAYRLLDQRVREHTITYADVLGVLALGDRDAPAGGEDDAQPSPASLAVLGETLLSEAFAAPEARAELIEREAADAQALADTRVEAGRSLVGATVARNVDANRVIKAGEVLAPVAGWDDEDLAIAHGRLAGVATAVVRVWGVPSLYFTCGLSEALTYKGALSITGPPLTKLTTSGAKVDVVALTTKEGHVLRAGSDGRYVAVLSMPRTAQWTKRDLPDGDPAPYLVADLRLAELLSLDDAAWPGDVYRPEASTGAVFEQAVLDYTLLRLAASERGLVEKYRRFRPLEAPVSPEAGAALKARTAALRLVLHESAVFAWNLGDREPTEPESRRARELTAQLGEIVAAEPMALFFVKVDRDNDEPPELGEFEDVPAAGLDGDAAYQAITELDRRLGHVDTFRNHLNDRHPLAARRLRAVHPDVLEAFSEAQRRRIGLFLLGDDLTQLAKDMGLLAADVMLLAVGLVAPPAALAAAGISAALGVPGVVQGFREAQLLTAMASLDLPDGFQLASADDAASARRWAWIGLGLAAVDVWFFNADVGRQLRRAAVGNGRTSPLGEVLASGPGTAPVPAPLPTAATTHTATSTATAVRPVSAPARLRRAPDLVAGERLSDLAFKELAAELRVSQRQLRAELLAAVDETRRAAMVATLRRAAATILSGHRATSVPVGAALGAGSGVTTARRFRGTREYLVVGGDEAAVGWGLEQLTAGRRTTAVAPSSNQSIDALVSRQGRFVQGTVTDLPRGYRCDIAREDLVAPGAMPSADVFVGERVDRLRLGGQWIVVTSSAEAAERIAGVAPRAGARIWTTEYKAFVGDTAVVRHVVVIARPRPTTMISLSSLTRPPTLTAERVSDHLAVLLRPDNLPRLQRKLAAVWHQGIVHDGAVADGLLKNLTGNIGEILADGYKASVVTARRAQAATADAVLHSGVRRVDPATDQSKEFTDDLVAVVRDGNLHVCDIFEVKAGPRGGQEGVAQLFRWMENELEFGDRIVVAGKSYAYTPGAPGRGQVIRLAKARRHLVVAKGAETSGRRTADVVAAPVVRVTMELTAAEIRHLARRIIEALPPGP